MESALYGICTLVFVSEISLDCCDHSSGFLCQQLVHNTVRPHSPWSILYEHTCSIVAQVQCFCSCIVQNEIQVKEVSGKNWFPLCPSLNFSWLRVIGFGWQRNWNSNCHCHLNFILDYNTSLWSGPSQVYCFCHRNLSLTHIHVHVHCSSLQKQIFDYILYLLHLTKWGDA